MGQIKVLAFCGSLRKDSLNKKLLLHTCDLLKEQQCEVTYLDLKPLMLPLYDGDLEKDSGLPVGAQKLINEIDANQALLVGSPEYNGSISGVLKNAIDWATRGEKNPFIGKVTMLVGTSPGHWGASKSLIHLRQILTQLRATVIPAQLALPYAEKALDATGTLIDPFQQKLLKGACQELVYFTKAFSEHPQL